MLFLTALTTQAFCIFREKQQTEVHALEGVRLCAVVDRQTPEIEIMIFPHGVKHFLERAHRTHQQEVKIGTATILCSTDGEVKEYDAEIRKIDLNHEDTNKSFVIKVTDKELLEATGGIVQGLSGSPVIQNGKIIGAVTHVFVQDASSGYGIFIENMLKNTERLF